MAGMDVERTMQFILDALARLEAVSGAHEERLTRLESGLDSLRQQMANLGTQVAVITDLVGRLAQAELRLVARMDALAESQRSLAESQAHTDRRLDALINIVDQRLRPE